MTVHNAAGMMKIAKLKSPEKSSPHAMMPNCEKHSPNDISVSSKNARNRKRFFRSTAAPRNHPGLAGLIAFTTFAALALSLMVSPFQLEHGPGSRSDFGTRGPAPVPTQPILQQGGGSHVRTRLLKRFGNVRHHAPTCVMPLKAP